MWAGEVCGKAGRLCLPLCEGRKEVGARGYRWGCARGCGDSVSERQNEKRARERAAWGGGKTGLGPGRGCLLRDSWPS